MPKASKHNTAVLKAIRSIVGADGMADLYAERGGTEICIPIECGRDHWMTRLFGEEKAEAICSHFRVFDADGRPVGDIRGYVPIVHSRMAALQEQIDEEIKQALISGKSANDVCRDIGVSSRKVRSHIKFLRMAGVIPAPPKPHIKPTDERKIAVRGKSVSLTRERMSKVDQMLMAGRTSRYIMINVGVGRTFVLSRRKLLLDAGRLFTGGRPGSELFHRRNRGSDAADHSANIGETVGARTDEVP